MSFSALTCSFACPLDYPCTPSESVRPLTLRPVTLHVFLSSHCSIYMSARLLVSSFFHACVCRPASRLICSFCSSTHPPSYYSDHPIILVPDQALICLFSHPPSCKSDRPPLYSSTHYSALLLIH